MNREEKLPGWLNGLLELKFDEKCERHKRMARNVKNMYCLHCCVNFCNNCAATHDSHRILQVRRVLEYNSVAASELRELIEWASIKPYFYHDEEVILLKQWPIVNKWPTKPYENTCRSCHKYLQEPFLYCSLACKIDHDLLLGVDVESMVAKFKTKFNSFDLNNPPPAEEAGGVGGAGDGKEQNLKRIGKRQVPARRDGEGTSSTLSLNKQARKT